MGKTRKNIGKAKANTGKKTGKLWHGKRNQRIITKVLIIINVVFAAILLISYLAPFVNPSTTTIPSFLGLAFPLLAFINLAFVLFWLILFRPYFIISTLALVLGLNHISSHFQIHKSTDLQSVNVVAKVMSYNVRMFDLYKWNKNEAHLENIMRAFDDHAPDILCIQEFYQDKREKNNIQKRIMKLHQLNKVHLKYWSENNAEGFGIATFTSFPIVNTEELVLSETPRRYALITDVLDNNKDTIRVFNIHLSSYNFGKDDYDFVVALKENPDTKNIRTGLLKVLKKMHLGFKERAAQADLIQSAITASPYPVVVCGDFNESPSGYSYRKIKGDLRDSFIEGGSGLGHSYSGIFPSFRIDYILHDPQYRSVNFRVYDYAGSDHNPLVCYLIHPAISN